jgi:holo-[acyl-carrier protein] synthase
MIYGIGTDITDVPRIQRSYEEYGERFLKRVFTPEEIDYCERFGETRFLHYAARFAAKEAFSKAIKTGMRDGMSFTSVGIRNLPSGEPTLVLSDVMTEGFGHMRTHVTLSHTTTVAVAVVVLEQP